MRTNRTSLLERLFIMNEMAASEICPSKFWDESCPAVYGLHTAESHQCPNSNKWLNWNKFRLARIGFGQVLAVLKWYYRSEKSEMRSQRCLTLSNTHSFKTHISSCSNGHSCGQLKQVIEAAAESSRRRRRRKGVGYRWWDEVLAHLRDTNRVHKTSESQKGWNYSSKHLCNLSNNSNRLSSCRPYQLCW